MTEKERTTRRGKLGRHQRRLLACLAEMSDYGRGLHNAAVYWRADALIRMGYIDAARRVTDMGKAVLER
jgi:hypothetical protein